MAGLLDANNASAQEPAAPPSASAPGASAAPAGSSVPPADADVTVEAEPESPAAPAPSASATAPAPPPAPPPVAVTPASGSAVTATANPPPAGGGATAPPYPAEQVRKESPPTGVAGTGVVVSGYGQGQYEAHQDSTDQLRQGGVLLNQNRFLLRRGRIRFTRDWDFAQMIVEIDANTIRGPLVRPQKAELSLLYGRSKEKGVPPIAQLTIGQFDLPFGFDLVQSPRTRWFMERSTVSRALWPGEPDVGARLSGGIAFARYAVAVTNGEPLDEKSGFSLQDPDGNKDVTVRLGAEAKAGETFVVSGGVSYNRGKGFHPGSDATKPGFSWNDANGNGLVDAGEIQAVPANAAVPSSTFDRWAAGADLQVQLKTLLGWSILTGEVIAASNLDRNTFIADPLAANPVVNDPVPARSTTAGPALRELGFYVAFTQEITPYGVVGFRYDMYNPNADSTDSRVGKVLPRSQTIKTYSPLVGLALPDRARLVFQYDHIVDLLARDNRGVPTDFKNDQWTLRLQVSL